MSLDPDTLSQVQFHHEIRNAVRGARTSEEVEQRLHQHFSPMPPFEVQQYRDGSFAIFVRASYVKCDP